VLLWHVLLIVHGFVLGYGYPVGMKSPVGDVNGENLSPRAGTGTRTGYISVRGDENVLPISVGDVPVAIFIQAAMKIWHLLLNVMI